MKSTRPRCNSCGNYLAFNKPSQANAEAFDRAVAEVSQVARQLLSSLHTQAPARDRETEAEKAKERSRLRFG